MKNIIITSIIEEIICNSKNRNIIFKSRKYNRMKIQTEQKKALADSQHTTLILQPGFPVSRSAKRAIEPRFNRLKIFIIKTSILHIGNWFPFSCDSSLFSVIIRNCYTTVSICFQKISSPSTLKIIMHYSKISSGSQKNNRCQFEVEITVAEGDTVVRVSKRLLIIWLIRSIDFILRFLIFWKFCHAMKTKKLTNFSKNNPKRPLRSQLPCENEFDPLENILWNPSNFANKSFTSNILCKLEWAKSAFIREIW